jgi:hypothetical protein
MQLPLDPETILIYAMCFLFAFAVLWPIALFLVSQALHGRRRRLEEDEVAELVEAKKRQAAILASMVRRVEMLEGKVEEIMPTLN